MPTKYEAFMKSLESLCKTFNVIIDSDNSWDMISLVVRDASEHNVFDPNYYTDKTKKENND